MPAENYLQERRRWPSKASGLRVEAKRASDADDVRLTKERNVDRRFRFGEGGGGGAEFELDRRKLSSLEDILKEKCGPPSKLCWLVRPFDFSKVSSSFPSLSSPLRFDGLVHVDVRPAELPFCKRRPISDHEYSTTCILVCIPHGPHPSAHSVRAAAPFIFIISG